MIKGYNLIGFNESAEGDKHLKSFSPVQQDNLPENFLIASIEEANKAVAHAASAFEKYSTCTAVNKQGDAGNWFAGRKVVG